MKTRDHLMHISDLQGIGLTEDLGVAQLIVLFSATMDKPVQESAVIIGNMTVGGKISKVDEFVNMLQVCVDAGAEKVLIPASQVADLQTVPNELIVKIQPIFYADPIDAVFKNIVTPMVVMWALEYAQLRQFGQTVGYKASGLAVTDEGGNSLTCGQIVKRMAYRDTLSTFDYMKNRNEFEGENGEAFPHDRYAGTVVRESH